MGSCDPTFRTTSQSSCDWRRRFIMSSIARGWRSEVYSSRFGEHDLSLVPGPPPPTYVTTETDSYILRNLGSLRPRSRSQLIRKKSAISVRWVVGRCCEPTEPMPNLTNEHLKNTQIKSLYWTEVVSARSVLINEYRSTLFWYEK